MGCRSDYMEPTQSEMEMARVLALTNELDTGKLDLDVYESGADQYNTTIQDLNAATKSLCKKLKTKTKAELAKYSLELQIWWRDHQRFDKERLAEEKAEAKEKLVAKKALAKLTPKEIKSLGLKQ